MSGTTGMSLAITTTDFSTTVGTTAVTVIASGRLCGLLRLMRIWNVSASATIWCSRAGTAVVNGAGSFPLSAGQYELWSYPQLIPANAVSIVASAANTPVTIEVG